MRIEEKQLLSVVAGHCDWKH